MNILGGHIKDSEIIGISSLNCHETVNPDLLYYSFSVITRGAAVEFKSPTIQDFRIATPLEQAALKAFRDEYLSIRTDVLSLLGEYEEEFRYHSKRVDTAFTTLAELHKLLEDELSLTKAKNKADWLSLLRDMRPHIIELKNLAE